VRRARSIRALLFLLALGCGDETTASIAERPSASDARILHAPARPFGEPIAVVDLMDADAAASVAVAWRFVDASIVEIDSNDPGPDLRPTGPPVRSHDVTPRPRAPGWDEAAWTPIEPSALGARRGHGHFALGWFRASLTLPSRIGTTDIAGTTVVFEIVADDYSEVWVDGHLSASPGDAGGGPVSGFNAPNRVVLTRDAEPGHTYDVAVLAMNAPLSVSPPNFLWVRSAVLDVYAPRSPAAGLEAIATGFSGLRAMAWTDDGLLFCDARANTIYRYDPAQERIGVWRSHSGSMAADIGASDEPGATGLAVDANERVLIVQPASARLVRIERTGAVTVLADALEGAPLSGLRTVAIDAPGMIWLTSSTGVLRVDGEGAVTMAAREAAPSALAIDHDGGALFVATGARVVRRAIQDDGLGSATTVIDLGASSPTIRGLVVGRDGDLWLASAAGITHAAADGHVLTVVHIDEPATALAWGEGTLFVAGETSLYRLSAPAP
jgi:gluconolactonase